MIIPPLPFKILSVSLIKELKFFLAQVSQCKTWQIKLEKLEPWQIICTAFVIIRCIIWEFHLKLHRWFVCHIFTNFTLWYQSLFIFIEYFKPDGIPHRNYLKECQIILSIFSIMWLTIIDNSLVGTSLWRVSPPWWFCCGVLLNIKARRILFTFPLDGARYLMHITRIQTLRSLLLSCPKKDWWAGTPPILLWV